MVVHDTTRAVVHLLWEKEVWVAHDVSSVESRTIQPIVEGLFVLGAVNVHGASRIERGTFSRVPLDKLGTTWMVSVDSLAVSGDRHDCRQRARERTSER